MCLVSKKFIIYEMDIENLQFNWSNLILVLDDIKN